MPLDLSKLPKVGSEIEAKRRAADGVVTYIVVLELGHGAFGAVYKGKCKEDGTEVAIKCEPVDCKKSMIQREFTVIRAGYCSGSPYFTKYGERGREADQYFYITMQLVDKNLWDLVRETRGKGFSLNTSMRVAMQTLAAVRDLHEINYIHRDIKPANFAVGRKDNDSIIYMLDFGMCRKLRKHGKLIRPRPDVRFRGTHRYSSVGALEHKDQSRKDDVESWYYMVMEFTSGNVPWNHCNDRNETLKVKKQFRKDEEFNAYLEECPVRAELWKIMTYIDTMNYFSIPHFEGLHAVLFKVPERMGFRESEPLDWSPRTPYVTPEWSRAGYKKHTDVYAKGFKKDKNTASEESTDKDGSKNENETTGVTGATTGIQENGKEKECEEEKRKTKESREEMRDEEKGKRKKKEKKEKKEEKKEKGSKKSNTEKLAEMKNSNKRHTTPTTTKKSTMLPVQGPRHKDSKKKEKEKDNDAKVPPKTK